MHFLPPRRILSALALGWLLLGCGTSSTTSSDGVATNFQRERSATPSADDILLNTSGNPVGSPWQVNGFLWRAALDTFAFIPYELVDPLAGTLRTEWHTLPNAPHTRYRVQAQIVSAALIPDSLRVTVFRQIRRSPNTPWQAIQVTPEVVRKLEDSVLDRARGLRRIALDLN